MDTGSHTFPPATSRHPRPSAIAVAFLLVATIPGLVPSAGAAPGPSAPGGRAVSSNVASNYIVQLADPPIAGYSGGIRGMAATSPRATGRRLDLTSAAVRTYRTYLDEKQQQVLAATRTAPSSVIEQYRVAFPGFAARLTSQQASTLSKSPGVLRVWPDRMGHVRPSPPQGGPSKAVVTPADHRGKPLAGDDTDFLGLPDGLWKQLGGPQSAGAGVIVGVIDTGIYPEHPSFADQPVTGGRRNYVGGPYEPPKVWNGACQAGEEFATSICNNKLIGARYFVEGFGRQNVHPGEFLSPRDSEGHGSHTASTAAGNYGVDPVLAGSDLGVGLTSGMAPRAYIAAYKVCWAGKPDPDNPEADTNGCPTSDSLAAIDAAVSDGVDVINYSVGSPNQVAIDPLQLAFLFAADAGIFVATSAGNEGPEPSSIGSPAGAPWVTSVAAATTSRKFVGTLTLTDGKGSDKPLEIKDVAWTGSLDPTPIVSAKEAPAAGVDPAKAELCLPDTIDAAKVKGKVVLCRRGENPLIEKGKLLKAAGAAGMIIYNADPARDDVVQLTHWLPTAHVKLADGERIKTFLAEASEPEAAISGTTGPRPPDVLAAFSSRGPQVGVPDIAKPDVTAPGVDILAANTPTPYEPLLRPGETFQIISGTSMASPHVAGTAALLTQLYPTLSPAAVKSALMTTATTKVFDDDGKTPAGPFDMGSGRIQPTSAAKPGLVADMTSADYEAYLEGIDPSIVPGDIKPIQPVELNEASISVSTFLGTATAVRTFTSIDPTATMWRASVDGLKGITAEVVPSSFTIAPGQKQTVTLRLTRAQAPFDTYATGQLTLTDRQGGRTLHLPITIQPARMKVQTPIAAQSPGASGSREVTFTSGFSGQLGVQAWGLAKPEMKTGETITTGKPQPTPDKAEGVNVYDVTVKPGTQVLGAATLNPAPEAFTDLDLFIYYDKDGNGFQDTDLIGQSAGATGTESYAINLPKPGSYRFSVLGYATYPPASKYDFGLWTVMDPSPNDPSNAPGLTVTGQPVTVAPGGQGKFALEWSGLTDDGLYLGLLTYYEGTPSATATSFGNTLVVVDKGPAPPPEQPPPGPPGPEPPPAPAWGQSPGSRAVPDLPAPPLPHRQT